MIVIAGKWVKKGNFYIGILIGIIFGFFGRIFSNSLFDLVYVTIKNTMLLFVFSLLGIIFLLMILWRQIPDLYNIK
ncbi:hypothetical protein HYW75_03460 [Candidatus Pacearchaeota archaeon]|nr:hypothetical protein [Candidatus Pacearchaeota archaeon]